MKLQEIKSNIKCDAETIADLLGGKARSGEWFMARCPAHDDHKPSLALRDTANGNVIAKCHAGCEQHRVIQRIEEQVTSPNERLPNFLSAGQEAIYLYTSSDGFPVFEKVRITGKSFHCRRELPNGKYLYEKVLQGIIPPLYRLNEVQRAIARGETIFLCEGEKDVETLRKSGLVATTNFEGAGKWKEHYSEQLKGSDVVVLPDNDEPGEKHAQRVASELVGFAEKVRLANIVALFKVISPEQPKKGADISDWFDAGGKVSFLRDYCDGLPTYRRPDKNGLKATYLDYRELLENEFGTIKRDIFTDQLFVNHEGRWQPVLEGRVLGRLKSIARDNKFYSHTAIEDHLQNLVNDTEPDLLVDIPAWDGRDRLHELVKHLNPKNCSNRNVEELIKDFGAKTFRRLYNPNAQNRILIIQGGQGIGKDYFIDVLFGGLGSHMKNIVFSKNQNEKDLYMQLASAFVVYISEFERTARFDTATLKDIITKPSADFRKPYGKSVDQWQLRCSFVASCNTNDILRDQTGNRRFIIVELAGGPGEAIRFGYPDSAEDKRQILAQFRHLMVDNYTASDETEQVMREYIAQQTPDDPVELLLADFDELLKNKTPERIGDLDKKRVLYTCSQLRNELEDLSKTHGFSMRYVQRVLKTHNRSWRNGTTRGYCLPKEELSNE